MSKNETLIGEYDRTFWTDPEGRKIIGKLVKTDGQAEGTCVLGPASESALIPGCTYEFYGEWKNSPRYGQQFEFRLFTTKVPASRFGIIKYLERYAPGIGPTIASRMYDRLGPDCVKILRIDPEQVVAQPDIGRFLSLDKAKVAAAALQRLVELEDTKIELTNLFAGRGFPLSLVEECVEKWKILAPKRIHRDPFGMLVEGMGGCGFARCDQLYTDLGLPLARLKRQVICLWHILNSDSSGHTWTLAEHAIERLQQLVSGARVQPRKVIALGCRAGWIARRRDCQSCDGTGKDFERMLINDEGDEVPDDCVKCGSTGGKLWLADGEKAESERRLARNLLGLRSWGFVGVDDSDGPGATEGLHG